MAYTLPPPTERQGLHEVNMAQTLTHRIDAATVRQDLQLLKLLQQEQQQLDRSNIAECPSQRPHGLRQWLQALISKHTQISIEKIQVPSGQTAWRVYDPRTRRSRYTESSAEVVAWLEAEQTMR
jgi:hypothetical protein